MCERVARSWCGRLTLALLVAAGLFLPACLGGDGSDESEQPGQISRPANIGLPLDDPRAVRAYDRADNLLLDWFILRDLDDALLNFSSNLRTNWSSIFDGTAIDGSCSFTQIEGSPPDQSGAVTARYAVDGCRVAPPGDLTASHITITVTVTDQNAWVISVEFD